MATTYPRGRRQRRSGRLHAGPESTYPRALGAAAVAQLLPPHERRRTAGTSLSPRPRPIARFPRTPAKLRCHRHAGHARMPRHESYPLAPAGRSMNLLAKRCTCLTSLPARSQVSSSAATISGCFLLMSRSALPTDLLTYSLASPLSLASLRIASHGLSRKYGRLVHIRSPSVTARQLAR